jgi:outer membrane receptor protein involved in Fe transport
MYEAKNKDYNLWRVRHIIVPLLILSAVSFNALGANGSDSNDLFNLSLEQLMNVDVYAPGTLTEKDPLKTPACVTVITSADIARTPARNILDLMEIYVPGMLWMNHGDGPEMGIRGIIGDRPYKYLVNVNGMNVNIKTRYGARLEILNWELSDIDRIEVIRGPGSVTYGPGAIGGVINIYTKRGKQAPGFEFGGHYWGKYDSKGNYISYGYHKDQFDLYSYFSMVSRDGASPDLYGNDGYWHSGYVGEAGGPASTPTGTGKYGIPPSSYMGNYFNEPEIKAHLDIQINDNWRFWARYVTASWQLTHCPGAVQALIDGQYQDIRLARSRYFQLVLENNRDISDNWNLKSTFGLSSIDVRDIQSSTYAALRDRDLRNFGQMFSEWEYFARFMLNYEPPDSKLKAALGLEVSYDLIRPSWGKGKDSGLRVGEAIVSGHTSEAYSSVNTNSSYFGAGNGFESFMYSLIGELNYQLTPKTTMIVSGRFDVHTYCTGVFSPRLAIIHELKKDHYLKFIAQKSIRLNTEEELLVNNRKENKNFPETLETLELIYSGKMTEHVFLETSVFFNRLEAIGWDLANRRSAPIGTLRTIGWEMELKYKKENFELGVNHSFVKQLDFLTANGIEYSGISQSDFYRGISHSGSAPYSAYVGSMGNDLANWSNHITKLYTNIDLFKKKVTFHGDIRTLWGFQGSEDALNALADVTPDSRDKLIIAEARDHDVYGMLITANLSLTYHVNKSADFMIFVQNIPVHGENKRYTYSTGPQYSDPRNKCCWVEEPMVVGFTYKIRF